MVLQLDQNKKKKNRSEFQFYIRLGRCSQDGELGDFDHRESTWFCGILVMGSRQKRIPSEGQAITARGCWLNKVKRGGKSYE